MLIHTLWHVWCNTLVDEATKLPTILSNESFKWPDVTSYLTETSGVLTR